MMKYALAGLLIAAAFPAYASDPVPGFPPIKGLAVTDPIPGCVGKVCGGNVLIPANEAATKIQLQTIPIQKKIDVSSPIFTIN